LKVEQERILTENYTRDLKRDVTRILELLVAMVLLGYLVEASTLEPINYPKLFRIFEEKIEEMVGQVFETQ
jgi:hypothetical protein